MSKDSIIIMGGGLAGMLSAACLSPHVKSITLIDRHPYGEKQSRGMPQSEHLHVMMAGGQSLLQSLIPNVWERLLQENLPQIDWAGDTLWHTPYGLFPNYQSKICTLLFSRHLLNQVLFDHIQCLPNVQWVNAAVKEIKLLNHRVQNLIIDDSSQLPVDGLLIDARGRGSQIAKELDSSRLEVHKIENTYRYYSTKICRKNYRLRDRLKQAYIQVDPKLQATGLVISPIEKNQAILTLIDTRKSNKMNNASCQAVIADLFFTHKLGHIEFDNPTWYGFNNLSNRRHYVKNRQWLKNLLIVGDALCYQNPVYGQGMTVLLRQVQQLKSAVINGSWPQQKVFNKTLTIPWLIASHLDQKYTSNTGLKTRLFNKSFEYVLRAACKYPAIHHRLLQILHQVDFLKMNSNPFSKHNNLGANL